MSTETIKYTEIAAPSTILSVRMGAAGTSTAVTMAMPYNDVKHLLSNKPLRRPNRTRSLDRRGNE